MKRIISCLIINVLIILTTTFKTFAEDTLSKTVIGKPNAKIVVKEYLSLTCSHCSNFHIKTFPKILSSLKNYFWLK